MRSLCETDCPASETPDEAVLDVIYPLSSQQFADDLKIDENNQHSVTSTLCMEDEELQCFNRILQLKKPCSSLNNEDYAEKIKEFQLYIEMVKRIARPGCSPEILDVALSSISSIFKTLSVMSTRQYMHASL